jgi:hypothetical protein
MKSIQSWLGKKVRIKREFIKTEQECESGGKSYYIACDNGMNALVENPKEAVFSVQMDVYGVDLFKYRRAPSFGGGEKCVGFEIGSVEPTHQIIIEIIQGSNEIGYPNLWDVKYFEEVVEEIVITKTYHPIKVD